MNVKLIYLIASYVAMAGIFLSIPFRRKAVRAAAGDQLFSLARNNVTKTVLINLLAAFLVYTVYRLDYNLFVSAVLCGAAIAGSFIITKDGGISNMDGVYKNAIICNGLVLPYEQIEDFPVFKLSKEDQALYAKNALIVTTKKKTKHELIFKDEETCSKVVELFKEMKIL